MARDPRFIDATGDFSSDQFSRQYDFLAQMHLAEHTTLREDFKKAKKLLRSAPRDTWEERAQEVDRLQLALKYAESAVSKDKREQIERTALATVKNAEREKRDNGKGAWWMKKC